MHRYVASFQAHQWLQSAWLLLGIVGAVVGYLSEQLTAGDNASTAAAIASECGILRPDESGNGDEFAQRQHSQNGASTSYSGEDLGSCSLGWLHAT